jgi:enoyl-CoA hydratase/carnithine racemase
MSRRVTIRIDQQVAHVSLNRPDKHNALDLDMFEAIAGAQREVAGNRDVRAVILSGEGVDFCTGLDVKSLLQDRRGMRKLLWKWLPWRANLAQLVSTGWRRLDVPVIAAIRGRCWGGGLQIALGADFRIAESESCLSIMEGKWGLIPDMGGSLALRECLARDQAMKLAMTAAEITGQQAFGLGLVTEVDPAPLERAGNMALQLADKSPDAIAAVKKLYDRSWTGSNGMALARETLYQLKVLTGPNQRIAVKRQLGDDRPFKPGRKF